MILHVCWIHIREKDFLAVLFELSCGLGTLEFLPVKRCLIVFYLSAL